MFKWFRNKLTHSDSHLEPLLQRREEEEEEYVGEKEKEEEKQGQLVASSSSSSSSSSFRSSSTNALQGAKNDVRLLYIREDILGFKVVYFSPDGRPFPANSQASVKALLMLQITGNIYVSGTGMQQIHPGMHNLDSTTKYCTNRLIVLGMQLLGPTPDVCNALKMFQKGKGRMYSGYANGNNFEYEPDCVHVEPRAGKSGCGCVHGLHFFTTGARAIQFYGALEQYEESPQVIITKRIKGGRGLIIASTDTEWQLQDKFADIKLLTDPNALKFDLRSIRDEERQLFGKMRAISFVNDLVDRAKHVQNKSNNNDDDGEEKEVNENMDSVEKSGLRRRKHRLSKNVEQDAACPLCFEGDSEKRQLITLLCTHVFHRDCLGPYGKCPTCNSEKIFSNKKYE